jgi:hypothetical protein
VPNQAAKVHAAYIMAFNHNIIGNPKQALYAVFEQRSIDSLRLPSSLHQGQELRLLRIAVLCEFIGYYMAF